MPEHSFVTCRDQQRSFDEMGTPLQDVTFCVLDLETTGTSPANCMITEIGAVKLRGGECLGTFQTMVNPGCAIPPRITVITGITDSMVADAPRIESVTPSLLEFIGDSVVVGHNVRFDLSFINATLVAQQRPRLPNHTIDTLALARRLLRPEVPNCRLGTLAEILRLAHRPSHRALDDALATGDLLHLLIERAAAMGATGLDDLSTLPKMAGSPEAAKLRLTEDLPRATGVYIFRARSGRPLYVGKAANIRARVRSYFSTDQRRKISQLLREVASIDHQVCSNDLEASVLEIRLIHHHLPRFNQQGTRSGRYPYVKLALKAAPPHLSVVSNTRQDDGLYIGPVSSRKRARMIIDAIEIAVRIGQGERDERQHDCSATQVAQGLTDDHEILLAPLRERIRSLAHQERFEEAVELRDRAAALSGTLLNQRHFRSLAAAGEIIFTIQGKMMRIVGGRLIGPTDDPHEADGPSPPASEDADELLCVSRWLAANASDIRLDSVTGILAEPIARIDPFKPVGQPSVGGHQRLQLRQRPTVVDRC